MNNKDLEKINSIKERWERFENTNKFCEPCLFTALSHYEKHCNPSNYCEDGISNRDHITYNNANIITCAAEDIWTLLELIEKM